MHFHVCAVDGELEAVVGEAGEAGEQGTRTTATSVMFHPASCIAFEVVAQAQASLRRRILRAFVGRCLLEGFEAQEMLGYKHSGFSVDTSVCIAAQDRAGLLGRPVVPTAWAIVVRKWLDFRSHLERQRRGLASSKTSVQTVCGVRVGHIAYGRAGLRRLQAQPIAKGAHFGACFAVRCTQQPVRQR